mmetsp:Transcript_44089/g.95813  ORF Transcript_44089/g.95813 Transcript_44089/m.95813 type:complete len:245 (-) Transcript_44089:269-1003(-)
MAPLLCAFVLPLLWGLPGCVGAFGPRTRLGFAFEQVITQHFRRSLDHLLRLLRAQLQAGLYGGFTCDNLWKELVPVRSLPDHAACGKRLRVPHHHAHSGGLGLGLGGLRCNWEGARSRIEALGAALIFTLLRPAVLGQAPRRSERTGTTPCLSAFFHLERKAWWRTFQRWTFQRGQTQTGLNFLGVHERGDALSGHLIPPKVRIGSWPPNAEVMIIELAASSPDLLHHGGVCFWSSETGKPPGW